MLTDDEALAVLLRLVAGRRAGLVTTSVAAAESAAAKVQRVLPEALGRRLDALLQTTDFTVGSRPVIELETTVLLVLAEAARGCRPVAMSYTSPNGRRSERTVHPYGIVAHSGRWYVTGADSASGETRTFRLDRITTPQLQAGTLDLPDGFDPAESACSPGSPRRLTDTRSRYGSRAQQSRSSPGSRRESPPCTTSQTSTTGSECGCGPSGWTGTRCACGIGSPLRRRAPRSTSRSRSVTGRATHRRCRRRHHSPMSRLLTARSSIATPSI